MSEGIDMDALRESARQWLKPKEQAVEEKRQILAQAYHETFDPASGKTVLADLANKCGLLSLAVDPTHPELGMADALLIWEGRRQMVVEIINQLGWSPMELVELAHSQTVAAIEAARQPVPEGEE